jgi:hypothetical protein
VLEYSNLRSKYEFIDDDAYGGVYQSRLAEDNRNISAYINDIDGALVNRHYRDYTYAER